MGKKGYTTISTNSWIAPLLNDLSVAVGHQTSTGVVDIRPSISLNGISDIDPGGYQWAYYCPTKFNQSVQYDPMVNVDYSSGLFEPLGAGQQSFLNNLFILLTGYNENDQLISTNSFYHKYLQPRGVPIASYITYIKNCQSDRTTFYNQYSITMVFMVLITMWHDQVVSSAHAQGFDYRGAYRLKYELYEKDTEDDYRALISMENFFSIDQLIEEVYQKNPIGKWKCIGNYPPGTINQRVNHKNTATNKIYVRCTAQGAVWMTGRVWHFTTEYRYITWEEGQGWVVTNHEP